MTDTSVINSMLMLAFRKAKADLYYSSNPRIADLYNYEINLDKNLSNLQKALHDRQLNWFESDVFLGSYSVSPNKVDDSSSETQSGNELINFSSRSDNSSKGGTHAVFRLMEKCSIDFHVLSALWIMLVGTVLDLELDDNIYANRLRRTSSKQFNEMSIGSFSPYYFGYREWQDRGFAEIEKMLASDIEAVAIMTDIEGYFHNLNPRFLENCGIPSKLKKHQEKFPFDQATSVFDPIFVHNAFKNALYKWEERVSAALGVESVGLPVGLSASGLIANLALIEFDKYVRDEVKPRYYGRYVDDIFMVLKHDDNFSSSAKIWSWLSDRIPILSVLVEESNSARPHPLLEVYGTDLKLSQSKTKITKLGGSKGKQVLSSLKEAIRKNSSEWNFLPEISEDPEDVSNQIAMTIDEQGSHVETLSKAKSLSTIRSKFAILIRNFEALARDVSSDSWKPLRAKFYETIQDQLFNPTKFFELERYFPRILDLAIRCHDWKEAVELIQGVGQVRDQVSKNFTVEIKSIPSENILKSKILNSWSAAIQEIINISLNSFPAQPTEDAVSFLKFKNKQDQETCKYLFTTGLRSSIKFKNLFPLDLAAIPFKSVFIPPQIEHSDFSGHMPPISILDEDRFDLDRFASPLEKLTRILSGKKACLEEPDHSDSIVPWNANGLFFATRPVGVTEIFLWTQLLNSDSACKSSLPEILYVTRGYSGNNWFKNENMKSAGLDNPDSPSTCITHKPSSFSLKAAHIPAANGKIRIALGSLKTNRSSMQLAARGNPDRSLNRYKQITALVNNVLRTGENLPHYLLLPEISIPASWFYRIATKLMHKNISLIAGVEYLRIDQVVRNQIWLGLVHTELGFKSLAVYRQDKQRPAANEESYLWNLDRIQLVPESPKWDTPPVVEHGKFKFSTLICSELTNTKYRANLRGKIDCLMIAENNPDLNTFNSLVEATALDVHCYVAQANNREYGDSRIRVPHKEPHKRDLIRIRGGLNDHFVIGEIDIHALRKFQSKHRVPNGEFKPLPDGFGDDMDSKRQMAP